MRKMAIVVLAIGCTASAVQAADMAVVTRTTHVRQIVQTRVAVRELQQVEVAVRPPGHRYVINGAFFSGSGPSCFGWAPKQRVLLLAGDRNGNCTTAVFRNLSLRRTCEMTCG